MGKSGFPTGTFVGHGSVCGFRSVAARIGYWRRIDRIWRSKGRRRLRERMERSGATLPCG
eukprot:3403030-Rhodomonas_salina.1